MVPMVPVSVCQDCGGGIGGKAQAETLDAKALRITQRDLDGATGPLYARQSRQLGFGSNTISAKCHNHILIGPGGCRHHSARMVQRSFADRAVWHLSPDKKRCGRCGCESGEPASHARAGRRTPS